MEFRDFLILQKEVTGLGYRFFIPEAQLPDSLHVDSLFQFSQTVSGFESRYFVDFTKAKELENTLINKGVSYRLDYIVLSEVVSTSAAQEYLVDLVRDADYPIKRGELKPTEDFVSLASQTPYSPTKQFKLKFLSDYRLFVVTVMIIFFFLVASIMIVSMLSMKAGKNKRENLQKEYGKRIIAPLTSLLFEKELHEIQEMELEEIHSFFPKNLLARPMYQHVLIDNIIGLNKKMKGDFKEKLKALYKKLGLDKISIKTLHHKKWDRATMALVQINEMDLVEALPEVKKFTNSTNFHVRSMAVATLLNLSEKVDLIFLRDQTYPLSLWQQMNYLRIIRFVGSQKGLKLEILFDSKNQSIRIFGIKLVRILGRVDLIEKLAGIAGGVSEEEKEEILETYAALGAYMETAFINDCLKSSNRALSLAAAKAAAVVGDSGSADILVDLIGAETVFRKKHSYLKSLYGVDKDKFAEVTLNNANPEMLELRNHILDPMLQNV
ncbi:hypothetical protein GCM10009119_00390 [Algoriphagus jejuensis]|uniref:HEAT repeat protein n=1 Tax=Algoriphagus jejuensis TaxID=419934 RepID=A0ABN1MUN1_9BACT